MLQVNFSDNRSEFSKEFSQMFSDIINGYGWDVGNYKAKQLQQ